MYRRFVNEPFIPKGLHTVLYLQMPKFFREYSRDSVGMSYILDENWAVVLRCKDKNGKWSEALYKK